MKVIFIKDFVSHKIGNVIETDPSTANFLIKKGVCDGYVSKKTIIEENLQDIVEHAASGELIKPVVKKQSKTKKPTKGKKGLKK